EERGDPAVRAPLDGADLGARGGDALLEPPDELLGAILDARHDELGARVLVLDVAAIAPHDGRDDVRPEDAVELGARRLDVVHPGALLGAAGARAEGAGELEDV